MMEVMILGTGRERHVIAGMVVHRHSDDQREPQQRCGHVAVADEKAQHDGEDVGQYVLHRVAVEGHDGNGGGPLVVRLMDVFVHRFMMK